MAAPVCFQAPSIAPATSVAVSFGVWCGGGLGKQRTAQPQKRNQWARRELFLLQNRSAPAICVAVVKVWREGSRGCKYELFFFIEVILFLYVMGLTWQTSIGWRKTSVLQHSLNVFS